MRWLFVLVAVVGLWAFLEFDHFRQPKSSVTSPANCPLCAQDVARASYYAYVEVDCDNPDAKTTSNVYCQDELEDVNRAPTLQSVKVLSDKRVQVVEWVYIQNGGTLSFIVTFLPDGEFNGAIEG